MRLQLTGCTVDLTLRQVSGRDGTVSRLTTREAELLGYLAQRPGQVVPWSELHTEVWGHGARVLSRAASQTARRLRHKIELDPSLPVHLETVHGQGLRWLGHPSAAPLAPLLGRGGDLELLARWLGGEAPLVTLIGAPGVGKTATARALAEQEAARGRRICWIDLVQLREPLSERVVRELGLKGGEPVTALAARAPLLLVLDHPEELLAEVAALAARAARVTGLAALVASRQPLGIEGERLHTLEPLAPEDAAELARSSALAVGARLDDAEATALARVLDGLPLAIVLAASQADTLLPSEIVARSDRPDPGLVRALASSWDALPERERQALGVAARLPEPWDLSTAGAALGEDAAQVVRGLVRRSLLRVSTDGGRRFSMLRPIRAFVSARAPAAPDLGLRLAELALSRIRRGPGEPADATLLEGAARELAARGRPEEAAELAVEAVATHLGSGSARAGLALAAEALTFPRLLATQRRSLLRHLTGLHGRLGRSEEHLSCAREALASAPEDAPAERAAARIHLANALLEQGQIREAEALVQEAAGDYATAQLPRGLAGATLTRGNVLLRSGRLDEASACYAEALRRFERLGDVRGEALAVTNLAALALDGQSSPEAAFRWCERALRLSRRCGSALGTALAIGMLGTARWRLGDRSGARAALRQATEALRELDDALDEARFRVVLADLLAEMGEVGAAQEELARAARLRGALVRSFGEVESALCHARVALAGGDHAVARAELARAESSLDALGVDARSAVAQDLRRLAQLLSSD
jgi:tetratricopeptide (TPR) repeat protein